MNKYFFLFFMLLFWSCDTTTPTDPGVQVGEEKPVSPSATGVDANNRTIVVGKRIGLIHSGYSEADLITAYGADQVAREKIGLGEGETTLGTLLFPGTASELEIIWAEPFQKIREIRINQPNSPWTTDQGVKVGLPLEALLAINGKGFQFYGFEWDYAGLVKGWNGGRLPEKLQVFLSPDNPEAVFPDLLGDATFSTDHPKAGAADLKVMSMSVVMNE